MNKQYGFTLVEIMIVVAILGLLVAIGVPGFLKSRNKGFMALELSNIKAIEDAAAIYKINTPSSWNTNNTQVAAAENISVLWPSSPMDISTSSYINKQLFCPKTKSAYGFYGNTNTAQCFDHGDRVSIKNFYDN